MFNLLLKTICLCISLVLVSALHGQTLRGKIIDQDGMPLAFTTVYAADAKIGTASNADGSYQLDLPMGHHDLIFQYLGHASVHERINIHSGVQTLNVTLPAEVTTLTTINVTTRDEDPAYTIMRKAIAKAKFHTQQLDDYRAKVYIKGSGRLRKVPWLLRKKIQREMAKEGIDTATAFVTESVSEISYHRPDQYEEKVISIRKIGEDNNTSPAEFIQTSFYQQKVNGAVSPLAPNAFAYYKFEYLGFIADRGYNVNKIKVTPRSRGDQVFEGVIYIIEDLWSIHSLDLFTYLWGIKFDINLVYAPVQSDVWMPINQIYDVSGSVFGFGFEYQYFANVSDYEITINPDLTFQPEIIDDKLFKIEAEVADNSLEKQDAKEILTSLESGKEVSRKQLRKVLREYEKLEMEELREDTMENVISVRSQVIDSAAYDYDSTYWDEIRPLPLTKYEVKGYRVMDSMAIVHANESAASDSLSLSLDPDGNEVSNTVANNKFSIADLLLGGARYKIKEGLRLGYQGLLINTHFNTVEGYHMTWRPYLENHGVPLRWRVSPSIKYSFARDRVLLVGTASIGWGPKAKRSLLSVTGGTEVLQINQARPIDPTINDLSSLLFERNYLKVSEQEGFGISYTRHLNPSTKMSSYFKRNDHRPLVNATDQVFFGSKKRGYTSNAPFNSETDDIPFSAYKETTLGFKLDLQPWQKFRLVNGRKSIVNDRAPKFSLLYEYNLAKLEEDDVDFHRFEATYKHQIKVGIRGDLGLDVRIGTFANADLIPFRSFKHFPGNRTFINVTDPNGAFRLLPYYEFSTKGSYLQLHGHYQFRKFLLTQLPVVRLSGVRENFFVNMLESPGSDHYTEVGFGINYIFRIFRVEFVSAFQNFAFREFGMRIGLAANLESIFD